MKDWLTRETPVANWVLLVAAASFLLNIGRAVFG